MSALPARPKITIAVPGPWSDRLDLVEQVTSRNGGGYLFLGPGLFDFRRMSGFSVDIFEYDANLVDAFEVRARRYFPTEVMDAIITHRTAVYLHAEGGSLELARAALEGTAALIRGGGVAVNVKSSGRMQTHKNWLALADGGGNYALYEAYVQVYQVRTGYHTCGMHLLGYPDASLVGDFSESEARQTLDSFLLYLLDEQPRLASGHTVSVTADAPRFRLMHRDEDLFTRNQVFYNRNGRWHLKPV
jgi:hypothetical protein